MTAVYFTPDAQEQVTQIDLEWRAHARTNPDLFWEQLLWAQNQAAKMRDIYQVYRWVRGEAVRRIYMRHAEHHLYYTYRPALDAVVVVAVWGARRRRGPQL